jgi:hypothetical protein
MDRAGSALQAPAGLPGRPVEAGRRRPPAARAHNLDRPLKVVCTPPDPPIRPGPTAAPSSTPRPSPTTSRLRPPSSTTATATKSPLTWSSGSRSEEQIQITAAILILINLYVNSINIAVPKPMMLDGSGTAEIA